MVYCDNHWHSNIKPRHLKKKRKEKKIYSPGTHRGHRDHSRSFPQTWVLRAGSGAPCIPGWPCPRSGTAETSGYPLTGEQGNRWSERGGGKGPRDGKTTLSYLLNFSLFTCSSIRVKLRTEFCNCRHKMKASPTGDILTSNYIQEQVLASEGHLSNVPHGQEWSFALVHD